MCAGVLHVCVLVSCVCGVLYLTATMCVSFLQQANFTCQGPWLSIHSPKIGRVDYYTAVTASLQPQLFETN